MYVRSGFTLRCAFVVALSSAAMAGPLDPPPGPISPTFKPLTELEPRVAISAANAPGDDDSLFKITEPGSYYLTADIMGVPGKHGIEIAAGGVTLDLNGFELVGLPDMGPFDGVSVTLDSATNISVRNGAARGWGGDGFDLHVSPQTDAGHVVVDLRATGNGRNGIAVGRRSTVHRCVALGNGLDGIFCDSGSAITACSASSNGDVGISTNGGSSITNCTASDNVGDGIWGAIDSCISACAAKGNGGDGIRTSSGCTIIGCTAAENAQNGIQTRETLVSNCIARENLINGVEVSSGCIVRLNICEANGFGASDGAGIHVTSTNNRIEDNQCLRADRGIHVASFRNFIVRNTCSSNDVNWDIRSNNEYGPIVPLANVGSTAVQGDAANSTLGTTDPNANFSY